MNKLEDELQKKIQKILVEKGIIRIVPPTRDKFIFTDNYIDNIHKAVKEGKKNED